MGSAIFWVLLILSLILFIFAAVVFLLKGPPVGCANLSGLWQRPNCVNIMEEKFDSSIPTPTQKIYLGDFTFDPNLQGGPLCFPMFYAFRYVRISDGSFGPLSPWTTEPIYSGAPNFPCVDEKCGSIPTGKQSCKFNRPVIVTVDPLDLSMVDGYVLNLHRQIGHLDITNEGDIVGMLLAPERDQPDANGWTSHWVDVMFNENPQGQTCKGC